ncbi:hypothetical protein CU102_17735 [Phyllobacterium brassicacearum]|uniref:Uncharacterized protein n=1 Tax=Phyllobacterium brassicacearum TaxID=314235 RepID=A0A2P7BMM9_9HYPH|nr:hypothetical protein CU102_17735 [Phyllobacterium brassicacearum]
MVLGPFRAIFPQTKRDANARTHMIQSAECRSEDAQLDWPTFTSNAFIAAVISSLSTKFAIEALARIG